MSKKYSLNLCVHSLLHIDRHALPRHFSKAKEL